MNQVPLLFDTLFQVHLLYESIRRIDEFNLQHVRLMGRKTEGQ